ncbi:MAG: hypothetical protein ACR2GX_03130 [Candidatus Dormibacteria bacterium]
MRIEAAADLRIGTARFAIACKEFRIRERDPLCRFLAPDVTERSTELLGGVRTSLSAGNREMVARLKDAPAFHAVMASIREEARDPAKFDPNAYMGRALQRLAEWTLERQRSRGAEMLDGLAPENREIVAGLKDPRAFLVALADLRDQSRRPAAFDPNAHLGDAMTRLEGPLPLGHLPGQNRTGSPSLAGKRTLSPGERQSPACPPAPGD